MLQRVLVLALGLGLVGCSSRLPGAVPSTDRTLMVTPVLSHSPSVQAIVSAKTADDVALIYVLPLREGADGGFHPVARQTGELLAPLEGYEGIIGRTDLLEAHTWMPSARLDQPIALRGLRADGHYRIVALAFDRQSQLISKVEESSVDLTLTNDDAPAIQTPLPLRLIDTPFGATATLPLSITGNLSRLDRIGVRLFRMEPGQEAQSVGYYSVPAWALPYPVQFTHLRAGAHYGVTIEPFVTEGVAPEATGSVFDVSNDDTVSLPEVVVAVP